MERQVLHHYYSQAKQFYKEKDLDKTRDYLDMMLVFVATKKEKDGIKSDDLIEGVRADMWLERAWSKLENWNLLL